MVVYAGSQEIRKGEVGTGVMIADHTADGLRVSARLPFSPITAGYNLVYAVGDSEDRPDGYMGNPVIVRYRFIPPEETVD